MAAPRWMLRDQRLDMGYVQRLVRSKLSRGKITDRSGFAFSFGVLQEYYTTHEPFSSHPNGIPTIGTVATGLMYLLMPLYFSTLQRWPRLKRYSTWASLPVVAAALIGASFAQTVTQLIAFQGVVFALGGNLLFAPTVTYLDEWFVRRKGLAIGIMW